MVYGPYKGVVDSVHDGDTIYVKLDIGFDLTIFARCRVYGINAPELSTPEGKEARDFAAQYLPPGTKVQVTSYGWDKYGGRVDAEILFTSSSDMGSLMSFGQLMLDTGHAVPFK